VLSTANITMQFGAKPLFENISVKFGDGNRYGLIGANGCGKSTFMKILGGDLEPSAGNVMLDTNERLGKLWASCARTSSRTKRCACSTWS
jgi:ATPase subunit of ABC transporter with duplicated ATPase domains